MSLNGILGNASSGLANASRQLAVVSQNVANASTPGYARETSAGISLTAGGGGFGVTTGPARRETDSALEAALGGQDADVSALQIRSSALTSIDAVQGTTGAGEDLASRVGALQSSFTALGADPSNQARQGSVTSAAASLAQSVQSQASAYASARQAAQDGLVTDVGSLNAAVTSIGSLSSEIIALQAQGVSTADLEAQRAAQEQTASQLGGVRFLPVPNGDVTAVVGGSVVDTRAASAPFSIAAATLGTGTAGPKLLLFGTDVTGQVTSGSIGGRLSLRDNELPQAQAGLDEFAKTLATRFDNQGLRLFTDPAGHPPGGGGPQAQSGYLGFSSDIIVNPAVLAAPRLVRDGTQAVAAGTGGASAFTPNPAGGPAGTTTLIDRVLTYALGSAAQAGTPQPAPATTQLGATGTMSLGYDPGSTLQSFAANLVGTQAQTAGAAQDSLSTGQALQSTLQSKLSSETGVSVDAELSNLVVLQNAYGANAKVITAAQSLWATLLAAVTP